jgi:hypothetical protein
VRVPDLHPQDVDIVGSQPPEALFEGAREVPSSCRGTTTGGVDPQALATALTWLGERLYHLAAIGVPPFDDERKLVDVLTHIWMSSLYPPDVTA